MANLLIPGLKRPNSVIETLQICLCTKSLKISIRKPQHCTLINSGLTLHWHIIHVKLYAFAICQFFNGQTIQGYDIGIHWL